MFFYLGLDTVVTPRYDSRAMQRAAAGVRVPYEIYRQLIEIADQRDCTLGQALDFYIKNQVDDAVRQVREEYEAKLKKVQEECEARLKNVAIGKCARCGNPIVWDLTDKGQIETLAIAVNLAKYIHRTCKK